MECGRNLVVLISNERPVFVPKGSILLSLKDPYSPDNFPVIEKIKLENVINKEFKLTEEFICERKRSNSRATLAHLLAVSEVASINNDFPKFREVNKSDKSQHPANKKERRKHWIK